MVLLKHMSLCLGFLPSWRQQSAPMLADVLPPQLKRNRVGTKVLYLHGREV